MMKKRYITALVILFALFDATAQQDPQYTQYMYNLNIINPAYAGFKENLSFSLLYRKQWVDIEDAPTTMTLSGSCPVGQNVGIGLNVISDQIGPVKENNVYADISYNLNLGGSHKLAFGMKAGATFLNIGLLDLNNTLPDQNDPAFSENINRVDPNIGAGLFYSADKFYVSFSIPNILTSPHLDVDRNGKSIRYGSEAIHYFLSGGYVFDLNPNLKFKPTVMLKSAFDAPASVDLTANFLFIEKFEAGAAYRFEDSFSLMINYAISPNLKIGYAYDHIISDLNITTPSSHEIVLLFDLNYPKKVSQSPRFF
jgi:type IX secretion system PorP/SprF family membrane protein